MRAAASALTLVLLARSASAGPCDIYGAAGTPCVAAHSVVRALYAAYTGPLYQVRRGIDNATFDVPVMGPGGYANAMKQGAFCGPSSCVVLRIYDQSPMQNHLGVAPPGCAAPHNDHPVNATRWPITAGGHPVYAAYFEGGHWQGYRNDTTTGVATGNEPETLYMVTSGQHVNSGCCFDYGNAEVNAHDDGPAAMECIYFGKDKGWATGGGDGPWVLADMEKGLFGGNTRVFVNNTPVTYEYVTAMVKGGENGFALKAGNAQSGPLTVKYDGPRPKGYQPMKKQGALILGIGGDNSDRAIGTFYEGVVTSGYSTDAADDLVQADIVAAGYGA